MKKLITLTLSAGCLIAFTAMQAQTGIINTIAGNGVGGYSGDGGPATSAEMELVYGICLDHTGNIYLDDWDNHRVREISESTGVINTIGGNGAVGYTGDGGQATAAEIHSPYGVALDAAGNIYLNDEVDNAIRKITVSTGIITTIAGTGGILGYTGDGGQATAAEINNPHEGIAFDASGNLYFGDFGNDCIRKINTSGVISTIAGIGRVAGYSGDGGQATAAELDGPAGLALDGSGNIYFADQFNNVVRKISMSTGVITTVAGNYLAGAGYSGDSGPATAAELNDCGFVAIGGGPGKNLYIADDNNNVVREVTLSTGIITTIAGNGAYGFFGDGGPSTSAEMEHTNLVAFPAGGGIIIGDDENFRFREILNPEGIDEIQADGNGIGLYPNPANNIVYLASEKEIAQGTIVTLYDISGRELWIKNITATQKTVSLNVGGISAGTYMLKIVTPDGTSEVKKLLLVK